MIDSLNLLTNPAWLKSQYADKILSSIHSVRGHSSTAVKVRDETWDNLLVLDACRVDLFEETIDITQFDSYEVKQSLGSGTREWITRNFSGPAADDIVYVTGSPVISRHIQTAVHHFVEVWKEGFDKEMGTVPPGQVAEAARNTKERFPDKRLVVHFLQPHYPFIGFPNLRFASFSATSEFEVESPDGVHSVWDALELGLVSEDEVWEAYKENLRAVFPDAISLAEELGGTSVITSDHGNLLDERPAWSPFRLYGHPNGIYHPSLISVPWAVIEGPDAASTESQRKEVDVQEQLQALGYAE